MRPLIRFLAKLYPPSWRRRYGAEFDALLEDVEPNAKTALNLISGATFMQIRSWNVGTILIAAGLVGVLVGLGVTLTIPKRYQSQSTISITGPITQETRDAINSIANNVLSRDSLTRVVLVLGLYRGERASMPIDDVLEEMKRSIAIAPAGTGTRNGGVFAIRFVYPDPALAQKATQSITSRFIEANLQQAENLHQGAGSMMEVLDPASLPQRPVDPRPSRNAFMGLGLGLTIGAVFAFFYQRRPPKTA
jgi:capsular polysaccharide biosynthesis protein